MAAAHRAAVGGGSQGGGCMIQDRAAVGGCLQGGGWRLTGRRLAAYRAAVGGLQGGGWRLTGRRFIIVFKVSPRQPPDRKKTGEKGFTWNILYCFTLQIVPRETL